MFSKGMMLFLIFSLNLFSMGASAQSPSQCIESLSEIIKGDKVKEEKLKQFLKLQSELTMHKLAYAVFGKSVNKERFTLEGEILSILDKMDDKRKDSEFDRVYKMFNHPKNKLSRHALAEVLPLISDILNQQSDEQDPVKRKSFNLGMSDIKILSILTEKEKKYKSGSYAQTLSSNRQSDNSILNFTKIINSSIHNSDHSAADIRKHMNSRLQKLNLITSEMIVDLLAGTECEQLLVACGQSEANGSFIIDQSILTTMTKIADQLTYPDKHKYLRYGDVWLYSKKNQKSKKYNISKEKKKKSPKKYIEYQIKEKTDDEIIQDHLVQHVLDHMPYFFKRGDLIENPQLTLALARAIDRGVLGKKDPEQRVFYYQGKEYLIPELWNNTYPGRTGGRATKWVEDKASRIWNVFDLHNDNIQYPSTFSEKQKEAFLGKRNDQQHLHDHKYTFEYKGKLYLMDGNLLKPEVSSILKFPSGKLAKIEKTELSSAEKKVLAVEILDGNKSFIKDGKLNYISGAPVDFDLAYARANIDYKRSSLAVKGQEKSEYPSKDSIKTLIRSNTDMGVEIFKGMADKKRAVVKEDKMIDLVKTSVVSKGQAQDFIIKLRLGQGVIRTRKDLNFGDDYIKANAAAIINQKSSFRLGNKSFHTSSGFKVGQKRKDNSLIKGMISHDEKHENIIKLNSLPQKDLIVGYHKRYQDTQCTYYTIIDKRQSKLTVFFQDGRIAFENEVLVGREKGDERTLYRDYQKRETNDKTGAGVYNLGHAKNENLFDHYSQFEGNYLTLTSSSDKTVISGLHQISNATPQRKTFLNNNDPLDNRATSGGISLSQSNMKKYMDQYYQADCPFYVLPEQDKAAFRVVGDQLIFETKGKVNKDDYILKLAGKEKGKPIIISLDDQRYINDYTSEYMLALQENKLEIMKHLNISNDEYNELVKVAFGILGTETDFAESRLYKFKETRFGQMLISDVKKYGNTAGGVKFLGTAGGLRYVLGQDDNNNSRGPTQIKDAGSYTPKQFDVSASELNQPRNAAIATMFVLANKYQAFKKCESQHSGITDSNRMEYLYYYYMGSAHQVCSGSATSLLNPKADEVRQYASTVKVFEKT